MTGQNDFSITRFSTDDLPEKDRAQSGATGWPLMFKVQSRPLQRHRTLKADPGGTFAAQLAAILGTLRAGRATGPPADRWTMATTISFSASDHARAMRLLCRRRELHGDGAILTMPRT